MLNSVFEAIRTFPPILALRKKRYDRTFGAEGHGCYRGAFDTFAEAAADAPTIVPTGYDTPATGAMYRDRIVRLNPSDYPLLFWLREVLTPGVRVFDLGGHVGITFFGFRRLLTYPEGMRWTICDVPAVVESGRSFAASQEKPWPDFTVERGDGDGAEVFLAAGVLQYVEETLPELLGRYRTPPRHVLVNKTPTHPSREFVTVQHIGVACCPYRIARADSLAEQLAPLGYRLVDDWVNADLSCSIPFQSNASPITYRGWYFRRD